MHEWQTSSYLSPKLEAQPTPRNGGCGVYARYPIQSGELLAVWGGEIMPLEQLAFLPKQTRQHSLQIEENLYLVPTRPGEPADYFNHSCEPNAGLSGQITLVALGDITAGEEICFDYAMSDGSPYDEFECACGTPSCRGRISGNDWSRPELWRRYKGHFSPYLQRRIDKLRRAQQIPQLALNGIG